MAMKYHLVRRRDMRKTAQPTDRLYYGQARNGERIEMDELCTRIEEISTASKGDAMCVLDGLIKVIRGNLSKGNIIPLGDLGTFRITVGSCGVENEEDFNTSLFKRGRITFTPGKGLAGVIDNVRFEKLDIKTVQEDCKRPHAG